MSNEGKIELETKELLALRQDFKELINSMVDKETQIERQRDMSKKDLDAWLNRVWSNFAGNIVLTDNPNFNFSEPLTIEEPVDESLQYEVKKGEHELQNLTEQLIESRKEMTHTIKSLTIESVKAESEVLQQLNVYEDLVVKRNNTRIELDDLQDIESTYNDAIQLLSNLETQVPKLATDYEQFLLLKDGGESPQQH